MGRFRNLNSLCVAASLACALSPSWAAIDVSGTVQTGDPVLGDNRLIRSGLPSVCGTAKAFPGTFPDAGIPYDEFTYTNTGPAQCVTFTVTSSCAAPGTLLTAYSGPLNPADVSVGYLGDTGTSSADNTPQSLALDMTSGQTIHLVVSRGNSEGSAACDWRVTSVEPLGSGATPVPTLGEWALLITGLLAGGLGARRLRRARQASA